MRQQAQLAGHAAVPSLASKASSSGISAATGDWAATVLEEVLTATFWLDPGLRGKPFSASVRFSGHRIGVVGRPQPRDFFSQVEVVGGILPGSGPVSITTRVRGVNPGEWMISAEPVNRNHGGRGVRSYPWADHGGPRSVRPLLWYRRRPARSDHPQESVKTGLLAFARIPGVIPGAWPAFVGLGVLAGLAIQALLIARAGLDVRAALAVSVAASVAGLIGAKAWYLAIHRGARPAFGLEGLCIQGFLLGAFVAILAALGLLHMPVGPFLDAAAPGLFLGMAIGRQGCFFAGCCAGRPTASGWGLWASDRRIGAKRTPTQLMESLVCLAIGLATLAWMLLRYPPIAGMVFVASVAAYTLARQVLLPLRAEPRKTSIGRVLAMVAAAAVLITNIVLAALA